MTLSTQTSRVSYQGDDVNTEFTVPFCFMRQADLVLVLIDQAGLESLLTIGTDYEVSGAGEASGAR